MGLSVLFPIIASILMLSILGKTVAPSVIQQIKTTKVDAQVIQTEKAIFEAILRYITLEQTNPASMNDLITKNYFQSASNNNGFGGTFSFTIDAAKGTATISTEIADSTARTAYINSYKNTFKPVQGSGNYVNTTFVIPTSVMHGNGQFMSGIPVQSTAPNASNYKFWYDTSGAEVVLKMSDGSSWKNVATNSAAGGGTAPTSLGTITTTSELPATAESGEIKYVYDSTSNTIQQYSYYKGNWVLAGGGGSTSKPVVNEGVCPYGFVPVPGSEGVDGWAKGWCVQKYLPTPYNITGWSISSYNTYIYQDAYDGTTDYQVISKAGEKPISYVSHNNAINICTNKLVDKNGVKINDSIPMSYNVLKILLKDISLTPKNWSGGAVGSGYIYSGHNDNNPATALIASTSDSDGYFGTGNSSSSGANQKRTLVTSKGDVIWDFAGNLWEQMYEGQNIGGNSSFAEYTAKADTHPFDPKLISGYDWNSTQGVGGTIYDNNVATIDSITAINPSYWLLRGGDWLYAARTGLFTSNWGARSLAIRGTGVSVRCIAKKQ